MVIHIWENAANRSPVGDFIAEQEKDAQARIMKDLDHFEKQGLKLLANSKKMKSLHGYKGLYEIKTYFKGIGYRILFTIINNEAWLLEAFKKKGDSTPQKYIDTASVRKTLLLQTVA